LLLVLINYFYADTLSGGESIWGKPFKDEFHSRLRMVRRGLVCMANAGKVGIKEIAPY
jgi:cyclophilin family peptidyl-prolyl cis-trans isomerase